MEDTLVMLFGRAYGFSALQRAEIAEMSTVQTVLAAVQRFSALQRAEIAEIIKIEPKPGTWFGFSALQRAEIAEIGRLRAAGLSAARVSVLFNEPKLLKF